MPPTTSSRPQGADQQPTESPSRSVQRPGREEGGRTADSSSGDPSARPTLLSTDSTTGPTSTNINHDPGPAAATSTTSTTNLEQVQQPHPGSPEQTRHPELTLEQQQKKMDALDTVEQLQMTDASTVQPLQMPQPTLLPELWRRILRLLRPRELCVCLFVNHDWNATVRALDVWEAHRRRFRVEPPTWNSNSLPSYDRADFKAEDTDSQGLIDAFLNTFRWESALLRGRQRLLRLHANLLLGEQPANAAGAGGAAAGEAQARPDRPDEAGAEQDGHEHEQQLQQQRQVEVESLAPRIEAFNGDLCVESGFGRGPGQPLVLHAVRLAVGCAGGGAAGAVDGGGGDEEGTKAVDVQQEVNLDEGVDQQQLGTAVGGDDQQQAANVDGGDDQQPVHNVRKDEQNLSGNAQVVQGQDQARQVDTPANQHSSLHRNPEDHSADDLRAFADPPSPNLLSTTEPTDHVLCEYDTAGAAEVLDAHFLPGRRHFIVLFHFVLDAQQPAGRPDLFRVMFFHVLKRAPLRTVALPAPIPLDHFACLLQGLKYYIATPEQLLVVDFGCEQPAAELLVQFAEDEHEDEEEFVPEPGTATLLLENGRLMRRLGRRLELYGGEPLKLEHRVSWPAADNFTLFVTDSLGRHLLGAGAAPQLSTHLAKWVLDRPSTTTSTSAQSSASSPALLAQRTVLNAPCARLDVHDEHLFAMLHSGELLVLRMDGLLVEHRVHVGHSHTPCSARLVFVGESVVLAGRWALDWRSGRLLQALWTESGGGGSTATGAGQPQHGLVAAGAGGAALEALPDDPGPHRRAFFTANDCLLEDYAGRRLLYID